MGGPAAQMKALIDAASEVWSELAWKDKTAAAFTHPGSPSGDKQSALEGLRVNAMQHGMVWVGPALLPEGTGREHVNRLGGFSGAMAQNDSGEQSLTGGDRKTAVLLGRRVAEVTARWARGK